MKKILVTGPTGYIGGRLVPRLLAAGHTVRVLARHPADLAGRPWTGNVEIAQGDIFCGDTLDAALEGVDAAYYLVHSMSDTPDFEACEETSARNFAAAAKKAGVRRVIYLGGLGAAAALSHHLRSRHRVGAIMREHGLNVTEFRAAIIVGSGSVSFEMIRYLVERLPLIPCFLYLRGTRCQPVAIRDVLSYLVLALDTPASEGRVIEIGGSAVHTYREMMEIYAQSRGLRRGFVSCPLWSPGLAARLVDLITPVPAVLARPLLESLRNDVVCSSDEALRLFPDIKPLDYRTAVQYALMRVSENAVETSWTTAYEPHYAKPCSFIDTEGIILQDHMQPIAAPAEKVYSVFAGIGGARGWFCAQWLWELKALQDRLIGGVGMRRGRRHPDTIQQGEALDFWRVERAVEGRMLLLRAEMKLPGKGWLLFEARPRDGKSSLLRVAAYFEPKGFFGNLYWYSLYPVHTVIFRGLTAEIKRRAETAA
ncbi:MAG: NmrA family protein [Elusimicrobia bacterium]|nr:MAG: NmrA family protein [Elusimicrobiota bacterium]KAF0153995.1 MAG: NmrA family protein [Elusimicrobiota bacterium]